MRGYTLLVYLAAVAAAGSGSLAGQSPSQGPFDPELFGALQWRSLGPERAGRSIAAAGSTAKPLEYYAGFAGGGLWKTTDGGTTWRPTTDGWIGSSSVGAVAVSGSDPDVVYIGTGEVQIQRNSLQGDGVYRSTDGGESWEHLGLDDSQVISRVRVHPDDPDVAYVAAFGHPWGPSPQRGVYRTRDGGRSWERVLYRNDVTGAVDLVIDRANPSVLYAALWQARVGPGGRTESGGPGSGLFKSTDGGDSWTELTRNPGLPSGDLGKIGVSVSGADPSRVYLLVEAEAGGVFRSDDAGATWTLVNDEGGLRQRPPYFNRIVADPVARDRVYVLNLRLYRSDDGGRTYTTVPAPHVDHHDLWIAPDGRMLSSNDGGPTVSVTGGDTWTAQTMPTAQLYHVATTRDVPYHVCGPQQDEAAVCVPSRQSRWRSSSPYVGSGGLDGPLYAPGGGEFGTVVPHPRDPNLFYATGPNVITRYDRRTGLVQARDIQVSPLSDRGPGGERFAQIAPLVFSRHDPDLLYTGSQHLWRMRTDDLRWERISPDLGVSEGSRGAGSIWSIAPSHHDPATAWVGMDNGLVHVTRDGGGTWRSVTPPGLPAGAKVGSIEASPHRPGGAYVAAHRYELDDRAPYVFRTLDHGARWTRIVDGLPQDDFVNVVREDPTRPGLLYAGTDHGVYASFDDGAAWQPLSLNLPDVHVPDLVVEESDLVIATQGRGFWVLDDVGPLRALASGIDSAPFHLFQPGDATRRLRDAVVDYFLSAPAAEVTVELVDPAGAVIRRFEGGGESGQGTARPTGHRGLNRFTWDLRYDSATVFPGMIMWVGTPAGPIAAPGRYRVRVSASGETRTASFRILRDPQAEDVSDADVREQFRLALEVRDKISEANEGVILIRDLERQISERVSRAADPRLTSAGESLSEALAEVEGQLYQVRLRSQLDAIVYPIMLNNRLANLKLSIETGDGRPTPQHYAAFDQLSRELAAQLERLGALLATEVEAFDRLLEERGLPALVIPEVG